MDMSQALCQAAERLDGRTRFDARQVFGKRVGKQMIFPVGLGSALAKAVREGLLIVVGEGTRRRGRTYELTPASAKFIEECGPTTPRSAPQPPPASVHAQAARSRA